MSFILDLFPGRGRRGVGCFHGVWLSLDRSVFGLPEPKPCSEQWIWRLYPLRVATMIISRPYEYIYGKGVGDKSYFACLSPH